MRYISVQYSFLLRKFKEFVDSNEMSEVANLHIERKGYEISENARRERIKREKEVGKGWNRVSAHGCFFYSRHGSARGGRKMRWTW